VVAFGGWWPKEWPPSCWKQAERRHVDFASEWPTLYVVASVAGLLALFLLVRLIALRYFRFRGTRLVRCPETNEFVAVKVAAGRWALDNVLGNSVLRLIVARVGRNVRAAARNACGKVELAPADCLLRNMLESWYGAKAASIAGKNFESCTCWTTSPLF
jgi:hypothetical protein